MASIERSSRDLQAGRLLREWRQIRRIEDEGVIPTPRVMFALASFYGTKPTEVWRKALKPRRMAVAA
jgi:hypothetical protein